VVEPTIPVKGIPVPATALGAGIAITITATISNENIFQTGSLLMDYLPKC
jgi:hypothetical protein